MVGLQNPANHILPYKLSPLAAAHVFFSRAPFVKLFETHSRLLLKAPTSPQRVHINRRHGTQ